MALEFGGALVIGPDRGILRRKVCVSLIVRVDCKLDLLRIDLFTTEPVVRGSKSRPRISSWQRGHAGIEDWSRDNTGGHIDWEHKLKRERDLLRGTVEIRSKGSRGRCLKQGVESVVALFARFHNAIATNRAAAVGLD